jgi:hypothetical protein
MHKIELLTYPFERKSFWLVDKPQVVGFQVEDFSIMEDSLFATEDNVFFDFVKNALFSIEIQPELLQRNTSFVDLGIDSITSRIILEYFEHALKEKLSPLLMIENKTIGELVDFFSQNFGSKIQIN